MFDVLRATTSMLTALEQGAQAILPVSEIPEALAALKQNSAILLAGERRGVRIRSDLTGSIDFHFGNSPREFKASEVAGKVIAMTTTNGTRALQACANAQAVLAASFANIQATASWLKSRMPESVLIVCSGTADQASFEDTLAAGALAVEILPLFASGKIADSVYISIETFGRQKDLLKSMKFSRNGRRLLNLPDLAPDVAACLRGDTIDFAALMGEDGLIRKAPSTLESS